MPWRFFVLFLCENHHKTVHYDAFRYHFPFNSVGLSLELRCGSEFLAAQWEKQYSNCLVFVLFFSWYLINHFGCSAFWHRTRWRRTFILFFSGWKNLYINFSHFIYSVRNHIFGSQMHLFLLLHFWNCIHA